MPATESIGVIANPVDQDFIKTTGMSIVAGHDLSDQDIKDISVPDEKQRVYHFVLNESAVRVLGWTPEEAIGKKMFLGEGRPGFVRGVVRDFNFESLREPIKPIILFPEIRGNRILVKLSGQNLLQDIAFLETKWKNLVPDRPFEYRFLDEDYNNVYRSEMRLGKIMNLFSFLAIILACLGLSGLSSYAVHQRMKEIGIRKVLGASVRNIIILLSGGFMKLTIISLLIALPLAQWCMSKWLQDFTFRTGVGWEIYLVASLSVVSLALITVAFQAVRAAITNPVRSLRSE
jgi:putative ABC transport system permease protein